MKYRVHRFDLKMTSDQSKLEQFLNSLEGEVVEIIPNVTMGPFSSWRRWAEQGARQCHPLPAAPLSASRMLRCSLRPLSMLSW